VTELDFDTVLATAVHEVKNLMGELSLNLEDYHQRHGDPDTEKMLALARVLQNRLVQILILQKAGHQHLTVNAEAENPAEFLEEVAAEARLMLPGRLAIELCNEAEQVPFWFIDRYLVSQVLMNAIHNAGKFARSRIVLGCREEGDGLGFAVADDGPGYPDLPGYRAETACRDTPRGTGLGLLFNERIAAAHGGWVARANADGARFTLWLPM
jgi:signal transduction histidine kinase